MIKEYLKFVIVGHVDHGKSSLIGRLLFDTKSIPQEKIDEVKTVCEALGKDFEFSYLMDYLTEEREKNITIDTTQTFFKTKQRDYVIIDAPGHKEFLKNMITGSSLAEAAILIVDADEGIKEQTKRHAYLLNLLNLKQIIVVINKMDLVDYQEKRFKEVEQEVITHLNKLNLKPNYIIPISAKNGDNIATKDNNLNWFQGPTVLDALDSFTIQFQEENLPLRLPVQDIYEDMVVGRIESGKIEKNQEITILPSNVSNKVLSIKKWREELDLASYGHSIGLKLDDIQVKRGQIICDKDNLPQVVNNFKATIFWMSSNEIKVNEIVSLKIVTQEQDVVIKKIHKLMDSSTLEEIDGDVIKETYIAEVEFKSDKPLVIENYNKIPEMGRFVLIQNEDIVAGGIIV
ncbi:GTP-binding protein [bacterium]|nr:GTP-binding protein [bacterium]